MSEKNIVSKYSFIILSLFFILIFVVFITDLINKNFGRELTMKNNSSALKVPTYFLGSAINSSGRPHKDVIRGEGGWLFYQPYVKSLTDTSLNFKALNEIKHMDTTLRKIGIKLIVVPVPVKAQIHSKKLAKIDSILSTYQKYLDHIKGDGIEVVDLSESLSFSDSYLVEDTHWSPAGLEKAVEQISFKIDKSRLANSMELNEKKIEVLGMGNLSKSQHQTVSLHKVYDSKGNLYNATERGEVLVLGDSFSNIFSNDLPGWGNGAGLAERLAFHLKKEVDKLAINNGGASGSRKLLMDELASGFDRLKNKKYIVWEFNFSEFVNDDWTKCTFPEAAESEFLAIDKDMTVNGKILSISNRNISSVYKDQLVSIRIQVGDKQALFRSFLKKDNQITAVKDIQVGNELEVKLTPVTKSGETFFRTDFDDIELQLQAYALGEFPSRKVDLSNFHLALFLFFTGLFGIRIMRSRK